MSEKRVPRGKRNKNPGNIRHSGAKWQGMAPVQSDAEFVQFTDEVFGIRALARVLLTYQNAHGLNTVRGIIGRYAPPNENDTGGYVRFVCNELTRAFGREVRPDDAIEVDEVSTALPLVRAIIRKETGLIYTDAKILEGLRLAGIADAGPAPLRQNPAFTGASMAGVGTTLSVLQEQLATVLPYAEVLKWLFLAVAIAGIGWTIYSAVQANRRGLA
jgi:hypothetical protein